MSQAHCVLGSAPRASGDLFWFSKQCEELCLKSLSFLVAELWFGSKPVDPQQMLPPFHDSPLFCYIYCIFWICSNDCKMYHWWNHILNQLQITYICLLDYILFAKSESKSSLCLTSLLNHSWARVYKLLREGGAERREKLLNALEFNWSIKTSPPSKHNIFSQHRLESEKQRSRKCIF